MSPMNFSNVYTLDIVKILKIIPDEIRIEFMDQSLFLKVKYKIFFIKLFIKFHF